MIVGGVPVVNDRHCHEVAAFAIDMVVAASQVASPATGKPLQVSYRVAPFFRYFTIQ